MPLSAALDFHPYFFPSTSTKPYLANVLVKKGARGTRTVDSVGVLPRRPRK